MGRKIYDLKIDRAKGKGLYNRAALQWLENTAYPHIHYRRHPHHQWTEAASECFPYHSKNCKDNHIAKYYAYIINKVSRVSSDKYNELNIHLPQGCKRLYLATLNGAFEARSIDWRITHISTAFSQRDPLVYVAVPFDLQFLMLPSHKLQQLVAFPPAEPPPLKKPRRHDI